MQGNQNCRPGASCRRVTASSSEAVLYDTHTRIVALYSWYLLYKMYLHLFSSPLKFMGKSGRDLSVCLISPKRGALTPTLGGLQKRRHHESY